MPTACRGKSSTGPRFVFFLDGERVAAPLRADDGQLELTAARLTLSDAGMDPIVGELQGVLRL